MERKSAIKLALGEELPELVLKHAKVVNVFTREIEEADVAISDGMICGVGSYCGKNEVELGGAYLVPGFINAHCHVESSMVTPLDYGPEELRWGVTTLVTDPHEIANVLGTEGVRFMLRAAEGSGVNYYVQVPSCVPATPFEHAGEVLTAEKMEPLKSDPRVLGLGEMMNYPGVAGCDPEVLAKLELFGESVIDGHAPSLSGKGLQAYVAAGIHTDHESTTYEEAREKLRAGMAVLVREGSASKNLQDILTGVVRDRIDTTCLAFCTDDKHLADIRREGTIRWNIRLAVELGLDPLTAIQMATINAARIYRLPRLGAVAVGYRADLVVLDNLTDFNVLSVYKDGEQKVRSGRLTFGYAWGTVGDVENAVNLAPLPPDAFALPERAEHPVIRIVKGQIVTAASTVPADAVDEQIASGRLRKIAVIERHHATGNIGVGLIEGYGLTHGAVATTVAHDSHNLIVVGDNDADLFAAVEEIKRIAGGYTIVQDGHVLGSLPLPIAGLMSTGPADRLIADLDSMIEKARRAGVAEGIDPFITLSFMALPVIPEIRITDMGVFDVNRFQFL